MGDRMEEWIRNVKRELYVSYEWGVVGRSEEMGLGFGRDINDDSCAVHHSDVIMSVMASQITSLTIVYSIVYWGADQWKHQAPRHWPLCGEFKSDRWIPRTNGQ